MSGKCQVNVRKIGFPNHLARVYVPILWWQIWQKLNKIQIYDLIRWHYTNHEIETFHMNKWYIISRLVYDIMFSMIRCFEWLQIIKAVESKIWNHILLILLTMLCLQADISLTTESRLYFVTEILTLLRGFREISLTRTLHYGCMLDSVNFCINLNPLSAMLISKSHK